MEEKKFKWVKVTLVETCRVPEDFTDMDCMAYVVEDLYENGGWPAVKTELLPNQDKEEEDYKKRVNEYYKSKMKSDFYQLHEGIFKYTADEFEVKLSNVAPDKFKITELLEHGFVDGDLVVFGTLHDNTSKLTFVGKLSECGSPKLIPALQKIYEHGPSFDCMYIETILMELYSTIVINYV